jgi:hypothetical protein
MWSFKKAMTMRDPLPWSLSEDLLVSFEDRKNMQN